MSILPRILKCPKSTRPNTLNVLWRVTCDIIESCTHCFLVKSKSENTAFKYWIPNRKQASSGLPYFGPSFILPASQRSYRFVKGLLLSPLINASETTHKNSCHFQPKGSKTDPNLGHRFDPLLNVTIFWFDFVDPTAKLCPKLSQTLKGFSRDIIYIKGHNWLRFGWS